MSDDQRATGAVNPTQTAAGPATAGPNGQALRAEFLQRAIAAVERIADAVDDARLQEALTTDTDAAVLNALGLMRTTPAAAYAIATDPLAAARARGQQAKRDILAAQGDMLTKAQVAERLECSPEEVEDRRQRGLLIALTDEYGRRGFPAWQFTEDGLLPGLEAALIDLGVDSPWSQAAFFFSGDIRLNWRTPLEVLLNGDVEAVRRAAAAYGEQVPA